VCGDRRPWQGRDEDAIVSATITARSIASRVLMLVGLAITVLVATAAPALAHAALIGSDPADGAVLDSAPSLVVLRFSEPVTVPPGGIRAFDEDLRRIDLPTAPSTDASTEVLVPLTDDLAEGGYVVVWRVVSADSHPVGGVVRFAVGDAAGIDDAVVAELVGDDRDGIGVVGGLVRAVTTAATLLAFGALAATAFGVPRTIAGRFALRAAAVATIASLAAVGVQAAAVTGMGWRAALDGEVISSVMASSFGQATLLRTIWLVALVVLLRWRAPLIVAAFAAAVATGSFALDGHQRSIEPVWLLTVADVVHLLAAGVWAGGLVLLATMLHRTSASSSSLSPSVVAGIRRFSTIALVALGVVALTGVVMSQVLVASPRGIATTYGWTLVGKLVTVLIVVGVAAWNRWRLLPRLEFRQPSTADAPSHGMPDEAGGVDRTVPRQLTVLTRIEAGLLGVVVLISGFLVALPPPVQDLGDEMVVASVEVTTDVELEIVIDPSAVGLNTIHFSAFDVLGMPTDVVDDVVIELTFVDQGIGPLRIEPFFAGTGHWIATTDVLAFPGTWQAEIIVGLDRFTEIRETITFDVRRR
jgi:copper transport protein